MKPAPFDYVRADSVEHAVTQLAAASADGEGKIIAGGQSLMPLLALRLAQPTVLIDINRVPGLDAISLRPGGGLRIGALTRHRSLARGQHPLLAEAARWVGHTAIRTRGTLWRQPGARRPGRRGRGRRDRARQRHPRQRRLPAAADPGPGHPRPDPGRRGASRRGE